MPSVTLINGKYRSLVRLKGHKPTSRYFTADKAGEAEAWAWGRATEKALRRQSNAVAGDALTVRMAVDAYRKLRLSVGRPIAPESNQHYMLEHLADDLGDERPVDLTPQRMVAWASARKKEGAGPYTVYMELSALGSMLRNVASYLNLTLPDVVGMARPLLAHLQLTGPGNRRNRRVLPGEVEAIYAELPQYADLLKVALKVGLRRGEICKIVWADLDEINRAVLIRKRKHPRSTQAKDQWVPLLGEAWEIVQRQPRIKGEPRIFPVHPQTLTKAFTAAVLKLGIPDLHLHDFRHEASSSLRDDGYDEIERMAILGHTRPEQNASYTHTTLASLHAKSASRDIQPSRPRRRKSSRPRRA